MDSDLVTIEDILDSDDVTELTQFYAEQEATGFFDPDDNKLTDEDKQRNIELFEFAESERVKLRKEIFDSFEFYHTKNKKKSVNWVDLLVVFVIIVLVFYLIYEIFN